MRQKLINDTLWVLQKEPYVISRTMDASHIKVNCNTYEDFCKLNPGLSLEPWNYLILTKVDLPYYEFLDAKEELDFDFLDKIINVSSFIDQNKEMQLQELSVPSDFDGNITYFLDGSLLDSSRFVLENPGEYVITAETSNSEQYANDSSNFYQINYQKFKYDATLSFANAQVSVSTYVDSSYTGNIQQVSNAPENVDIKYYLNNSLLDSSVINLTEAGQYQVKAAIVSDELYNDTSTSYQINYSKVKRDVILSFADSSVNITVEDVTTYSGNVQTVSGLPTGVTANYYIGNTLLSNGQIEISDLEEGENTFTITAKIENDSVYNDAQASYTLNITMEISSYENKYFTIEPLEDGTIKFAKNDLQYSTDKGTTWNTLTKETSLGVTNGNNVIFKCTNPTIQSMYGMGTFSSSGQFNVSGSLMSLKHGDNFKNQTLMDTKQFQCLFKNSKVVNAENLILPSGNVSNTGFAEFFSSCNKLTKGPVIYNTGLANYCYQHFFKDCINLSYIKILSEYSNSNQKYDRFSDNVSTNGTFIKAKNQVFPFGGSGIPFNWKVINNETNKEVYPLKFTTATVDVSSYTGQNYTGTIQDISCNRTIPNGLVKYYLDSSLLASNNVTLTSAGNHTVLAQIIADSSIDDSSAYYTINYTQVAPPEPELYWQSMAYDTDLNNFGGLLYGVRVPVNGTIIDQTQDWFLNFESISTDNKFIAIYYDKTGYFYKRTMINGVEQLPKELLIAENGYYTIIFEDAPYEYEGSNYEGPPSTPSDADSVAKAPFDFEYALDYDPNE